MVSFVPFKDLKPGDRFTLKDSEFVLIKLSIPLRAEEETEGLEPFTAVFEKTGSPARIPLSQDAYALVN